MASSPDSSSEDASVSLRYSLSEAVFGWRVARCINSRAVLEYLLVVGNVVDVLFLLDPTRGAKSSVVCSYTCTSDLA